MDALGGRAGRRWAAGEQGLGPFPPAPPPRLAHRGAGWWEQPGPSTASPGPASPSSRGADYDAAHWGSSPSRRGLANRAGAQSGDEEQGEDTHAQMGSVDYAIETDAWRSRLVTFSERQRGVAGSEAGPGWDGKTWQPGEAKSAVDGEHASARAPYSARPHLSGGGATPSDADAGVSGAWPPLAGTPWHAGSRWGVPAFRGDQVWGDPGPEASSRCGPAVAGLASRRRHVCQHYQDLSSAATGGRAFSPESVCDLFEDNFEPEDLSTIYTALTVLGTTPWRVQARVLDVLQVTSR